MIASQTKESQPPPMSNIAVNVGPSTAQANAIAQVMGGGGGGGYGPYPAVYGPAYYGAGYGPPGGGAAMGAYPGPNVFVPPRNGMFPGGGGFSWGGVTRLPGGGGGGEELPPPVIWGPEGPNSQGPSQVIGGPQITEWNGGGPIGSNPMDPGDFQEIPNGGYNPYQGLQDQGYTSMGHFPDGSNVAYGPGQAGFQNDPSGQLSPHDLQQMSDGWAKRRGASDYGEGYGGAVPQYPQYDPANPPTFPNGIPMTPYEYYQSGAEQQYGGQGQQVPQYDPTGFDNYAPAYQEPYGGGGGEYWGGE
jgi:hypothetical protein